MRVVSFSPYAGIGPHALPEAIVVNSLVRSGSAEVTYITCDGLLDAGCIVMSAHGVSHTASLKERHKICTKCKKFRDRIVAKLGVNAITLESLVDGNSIQQYERFVLTVPRTEVDVVELDGIPVGRHALHETLIHFKLTDLTEMTESAMADYRVMLRNVLITHAATLKFLKMARPDRVIVYNSHLSTNLTLTQLCERSGVPVFSFHAGMNMADRLSSLYVFRPDMVVMYRDLIRRFDQEWQHVPGTAAALINVTEHYLALAKGKTAWVYSAPASGDLDLRARFGVKQNQKILLATLSSYDELFSTQMAGLMERAELMFANQAQWLSQLVKFLAHREDLFLIIRVHPREFPNHRDAVLSNHAKMLKEVLDRLPENVCVNWPTDGLSIYDIAPQVDVGLNSWSSTGKELSLLGVPVVIYTDKILYYPGSLNILASNHDNYLECIDQALREGWSLNRIRQTYRWLAYEYTHSTIDISDAFKYTEGDGRANVARRALRKLKREFWDIPWTLATLSRACRESKKFAAAILDQEDVVTLNCEEADVLSEEAETELLRRELGRTMDSVYRSYPAGANSAVDNIRQFVRKAV